MKVTILCGKFGMGHLSAAIALQEQLEKDIPNVEVNIYDFIKYAFPGINKIMYTGFQILTTKTTRFFEKAYRNSASNDLNPLYLKYMVMQFARFIKKDNPDIIISTLPEVARVVSEYKKRHRSNIPLVTCITDITKFYEWVNYKSDLYLVPSASVRKFLVGYGISNNIIMTSGIPVKQKFHNLKKITKEKKQLLIMGGGIGNIPLPDEFYEMISKHKNIEVTVLCAKNTQLYEKLLNKYANIKPLMFVNNVEEYMACADLVITKTGGITTFECIYARLPIITYRPFLPQEKLNAEFLEKNQAARIMWDTDNPYNIVLELFESNLSTIMAQNMDYIKNQLDGNISQRIYELHCEKKGYYDQS